MHARSLAGRRAGRFQKKSLGLQLIRRDDPIRLHRRVCRQLHRQLRPDGQCLQNNVQQTDNNNQRYADARAKIQRLRKRDKELTEQINFVPAVAGGIQLSPEAWGKKIETAKLRRDNEAKRGGCGRICEQRTQELTDMQAAKVNASARLVAIEERKQIRSELAEAETFAAAKPKTISVAQTQAASIAQWFDQNLDVERSKKDWAMLYISAGISLMISVFAHLCNLIRAMDLAGATKPVRERTLEITSETVPSNPQALIVASPQQKSEWAKLNLDELDRILTQMQTLKRA